MAFQLNLVIYDVIWSKHGTVEKKYIKENAKIIMTGMLNVRNPRSIISLQRVSIF